MNVLWHVFFASLIRIIAIDGYQSDCSFVEKYTFTTTYLQTFQRWQPNHNRWFWQKHGKFVTDSYYATKVGLGTRIAKKCCSGYAGIFPYCTPFCSRNCLHGECIAPEVCSCFSGYTSSMFSNYECKPSCSGGCGENRECTAPDVCTCLEGFTMEGYNRCTPICDNGCPFGKCVAPNKCQCDPGYDMNLSETACEPNCLDGCGENGNCTAPNVCACFEGFRLEGQNRCLPICDSGCPFGKCIAPNKCQCDPGYDMNSSGTTCEPYCLDGCGANGTCTAPDVCTCSEGFRIEGHNHCLPICDSGCPFGKCIAPNKCQCDPGYDMNSSVTTCEPYCLDGCGENGTCTAPDVCTCFEGFRIEGHNHCLPICDSGCPFGKCIAPNKCQCDPGYDMNSSGTLCEPFCWAGCGEYGECTAPDVCTCLEGFRIEEGQNRCLPICDNGCPFGKCIAPNKCKCDPGYDMNLSGTDCEPICSNGCDENGTCTAPDVCTCFEGFRIEGHNRCLPICDSGCPFGKCIAPNKCQCDPGYGMNLSGTACEPICLDGCGENGECTAPDGCTCFEGFRIEEHNRCLPICDNGCPYGKCINPNICECQPGYATNPSTEICEPICSQGCDHGFCFRPGICVCDHGYLMGPNDKCEPVCSDGCINGICAEPDVCLCSPGYKMALNSMSSCEPICVPECHNSNCVEPDVCLCWQDYIPTNETYCEPNCPEKCVNGYCDVPYNCTCKEGYEPHLYEPNVCTPMCFDCDQGDCIAPRRCLCWPGYETVQNGSGCYLTTRTSEKSTTDLSETSSTLIDTTEMTLLSLSTETTNEEISSTVTFLESTSTESSFGTTTQSIVFETISSTSPLDEAKHTSVKQSNVSPPLELFDCKCWVLPFAGVNASNPGSCITECITNHEINCIKPQACQTNTNQTELTCNSKIYVCRALGGISSKVISTSGWLFWAILAGVLLACIIGFVFAVRQYRYRGSAVLANKPDPEYVVQYVQR